VLTILHGSDVHFGRPHDLEAARLFVQEIDRIGPDALVLAGDFTQRAKRGEYRDVRVFLDGLRHRFPTVVTPGNHDVALYRFWERLAYPFRNYRHYVHDALDYTVRVEGATFVSLNTAAPRRRIVNGRLDAEQLDFAEREFADSPAGDLRCLVMHHPLVAPPDEGRDPTLPDAERALARVRKMGVELVFAGHLHRAFALRAPDAGPVMSHSGTVSSTRGRHAETLSNSFNLVRAESGEIRVTRFLREAGGAFEETWTRSFERPARPADNGVHRPAQDRASDAPDAAPVKGAG